MANPDVYSPCHCGSGKKYKFCCFQKDREARDAARGVAPDGFRALTAPGRTRPYVATKHLYTFEVYLRSGPIPKNAEGKTIRRTIEMPGSATLSDLHELIFEAYNREEEHLWDFQIGAKKWNDPAAKRYGPPELEGRALDAESTTIDSLQFKVGDAFGYTFDFGDDWKHDINVDKIEELGDRKPAARIVKKTGKAPPQYANR